MDDTVEWTLYALYPLKSRQITEFLNFIQLLSPYKASDQIIESITDYSTVIKSASNIHRCQIIERYVKDKSHDHYMKYYPSTLIRKKDLKVNAKAWNIFKFKDGSNNNLFMTRSGYEENFVYYKDLNEFYYDTFDNVTEKVDDLITLSIFKLRGKMKPNDEMTEWDLTIHTKYEGSPVFEEIKSDEVEEKKEIDQNSGEAIQSSKIRMYFVELRGYCRMIDLESFSEELYNFSKKFEPYVQFRKSTL